MSISEMLTEIDGQRCHESCKDDWEKQWRKTKGLDDF